MAAEEQREQRPDKPKFSFAPPTQFDFKRPEEWSAWSRRFMRYRRVSRLIEEDGPAQVDALIYCLGGDAEDILAAATLSGEEKVDFDNVIEVFQGHCVGKRNVMYERARFHQRKQEPGETVEAFVMALHKLVAHCGYGALKDELLRDRLVVGLRDAELSKSLQSDPELTLETAVQKARQKEAVRRQQGVVCQENQTE
ncbi:unnamed protein product [Ixodes persulcatus]